MTDETQNQDEPNRSHNNPAVERFKQGKRHDQKPQQATEGDTEDQASTGTAAGGPPDEAPTIEDPIYDDEPTGSGPDDSHAAIGDEASRPLFYDNPIEADNTSKGAGSVSILDRVRGVIDSKRLAGPDNVLQRLAARGKARARGRPQPDRAAERDPTATGSKADDEAPVEALSNREIRKQRKARAKAEKAHQKPEGPSEREQTDRGKQKGLGKGARAVAAALIAGVVIVAYQAGYKPPILKTLLEGRSAAGTTAESPPTGAVPSADSDPKAPSSNALSDSGSNDGLPSIPNDSSSGAASFEDNASFGDEGLPSLGDRDFSSTPDGVQKEVASIMDEAEDTKSPPMVDDPTPLPAEITAPFFTQTLTDMSGSTLGPGEGTADAVSDPQSAVAAAESESETSDMPDAGTTATADKESGRASVAESSTEDGEVEMPEAVSPRASVTHADNEKAQPEGRDSGANTSVATVENPSDASPAEPEVAARLREIEKKLKASERKIDSLTTSDNRSSSQRAPVSNAKPDIELLAISIARYCNNCMPLVTVVQDGETLHLSQGDSFEGYKVAIKGDRLMLVRGSVQHSYYPGS